MEVTPASTTPAVKPPTTAATTPAVPKPKTLAEYLELKKQTAEELLASSYGLQNAARALLLSHDIDAPTTSQIKQVTLELAEALKAGKFDYSPHLKPRIVQLEDNVEQLAGNVFYERDVLTDADLKPMSLKLNQSARDQINADFESGLAGMLLAATFISSDHRMEGDFSHAYGKRAWDSFLDAHEFLEGIPRGEFLNKLDTSLLTEVNRLAYSPDEGLSSTIKRTVNATRRGHFEQAGTLRTANSYYSPKKYTKANVEQLQSLGIRLIGTKAADGSMRAFLQYPDAKIVPATLESLLTEVKSRLTKEGVTQDEIIAAIASFHRKLVALHPFEDGNGRTSRLVLNRLLSEFDYPPSIFDDPERDIVISEAAWEREVKEGMARSKKFITSRSYTRSQFADLNLKASFTTGITPPVMIGGHPYDLSAEGFLFSLEGRAALVVGGELIPLAQMEYYVLSRRLGSMPHAEGQKALEQLTAETRALYEAYRKDPATAPVPTLQSEEPARHADSKYLLHPHAKIGQILVDLVKVDRMEASRIWDARQASMSGSIMSKFTQIDLELWHVEKGLKDSKLKPLAAQVHGEREKLFQKAKTDLEAAGVADKKSPANPLGLTYRFEKLMFDNSPLRFPTLKAAIHAEGDDGLVLWRGDYATTRLLGMAPNNDPRQPDAKKVARERFEKGGIGFMQNELTRVQGSSKGRQYISNTSDLELLTKAFSTNTKSQTLNLTPVPGWARDRIEKYVSDRMVAPEPEQKKPGSYGGSPNPTPVYEIKDELGIPGTLVKLETLPEHRLRVTSPRKAFRVLVNKEEVLPGLRTLGGTFQHEQEVYGLSTVYPWDVREAYTDKQLLEKLDPEPVKTPPVTTPPVTTPPVTTPPVTTPPVTTPPA